MCHVHKYNSDATAIKNARCIINNKIFKYKLPLLQLQNRFNYNTSRIHNTYYSHIK